MKSAKLHHRPVSVFVIVTFTVMLCCWANQAPAAPAVPAPEKSSPASMASDEGTGPGFIEQEESTPAARKAKKFPWLIVAAVVIVGGAALYFLVLKKKNYTLTVTSGEGVTGTPAAGTSTSKKGTVINYSYSLQSGYSNLAVTLDGAPVAASGSVTMNADHTLAATAAKTFVLTVIKGEHVDGSPEGGTYTYARGTNVPYSYFPAGGYSSLQVKIDNVNVPAAGAITMDNNHTLSATLLGANIEVTSTPAGARIYLDNVDSGHSTPYTFTFPAAVTNKAVHLRYSCGYKEYREVVSVAVGQTKIVNRALVPGIWEEFLIPASPCWQPYTASRWTSLLELYRYIGNAAKWDMNVYNYSFSGDYAVSEHMNRKKGNASSSNTIFLGTGTDMTNASGYGFQYLCNGSYSVYRWANRNFVTNTGGTETAIKTWTATPAIHQGLNQFNLMKVVKTGTTYSFYINNILVTSVTDATYNPTYLALLFFAGGIQTEIQYNYVILTPGGSAVTMPVSSFGAEAQQMIDGTGDSTGVVTGK